MVIITPAPPALASTLELFHTTDPLLSNSPVVVLYGPAATIASSSTRIQVHIFTPAGFESYPRLAISPSSPYYAAVKALPREEQGDEVCRGLAFGLSKYFAEIPRGVRDGWITQACSSRKAPSAFALFSDPHIAILASRMTRVEQPQTIIDDIQGALSEQSVSWLDLDVFLPPGSIQEVKAGRESTDHDSLTEVEHCARRYGQYAPLVRALGEPAFLPTSKLRRAPSKATAVGRSQVFGADQKQVVRKEMCELVDTEESYVGKLSSLIREIARDFKQHAAGSPAIPVTTQSERTIDAVFPSSLEGILDTNAGFLSAIRDILDSTDEAAMDELQTGATADATLLTYSPSDADVMGVYQFARCLLHWVPKFAQNYPTYIAGHAKVPLLLRQLSKCADPAIAAKVQEIGEQRLMSMLIEPIQRLPRYTLYIDSIAKQLPVGHPALKLLLRARDTVTDICSQDASGIEQVNVVDRLQRLVQGWPADAKPGRLVSVVDISEMEPPYDLAHSLGVTGLLLLFTDCMVFVEKSDPGSTTARTLLAELDKPRSDERGRPMTPPELFFIDLIDIGQVSVMEYLDGKAISVIREATPSSGTSGHSYVFLLEGTYAGKASRFSEDLTKARVEGRYSESERESGRWDVRSAASVPGELGLFSAVLEDVHKQRQVGPTRLVIDSDQVDGRVKPGYYGLQTVIAARRVDNEEWQLIIESTLGSTTRDHVTEDEVLSTIVRRLTSLLQAKSTMKHPTTTSALIARNQQILLSLSFQPNHVSTREASVASRASERHHRPISPVKLLSSFLSSTGPGHQPNATKKAPNPFSVASDALAMPPPELPRPVSKDTHRPASHEDLMSRPSPDLGRGGAPMGSTKKLEDTLSTYLLALQARKGNVVGRSLKARQNANDLAVRELYNSLLEDPNMMVLAAQASVDVLFAAFERFLNGAWTDRFGLVMSRPLLQKIQDHAESLFPIDFELYFKDTFHTMTLQNQRALRGIVKLLAELLDGTGNDSDRGILTAAFAEVLVPGEDPYTFVSLIDRFVDDIEPLFGETVEVRDVKVGTGSVNAHERSRSTNTGSLTSNTSSLRKKFGFGGITRENSKSEPDSKVGSVWRTLSKNKQAGEQPSSISRGTMQRAKSTDIDRRVVPERPASQDASAALGAFPFERPGARDTHTFMQSSPLGAISENSPAARGGALPRRKRRSSLSDLTTLEDATASPTWPPSAKRLDALRQPEEDIQQSPLASLSRAASVQATGTRIGSPARSVPRSRLPSTFRKENSPGPDKAYTAPAPRMRSGSKQPDEVTITSHPSVRRNELSSGIPTLTPTKDRADRTPSATPVRSGLSERPNSGNAMKPKPTSGVDKPLKGAPGLTTAETTTSLTSTPTKRLRMQSPQKLRERLQLEQKAQTTTSSSLADELSKIGDEISALPPGRMGSVRMKASPYLANSHSSHSSSTLGLTDLSSRLSALETSVQAQLAELGTRTAAVQADLQSSLTVSESKARKLDELYREANAENEALYSRFNDELGKVVKAVRGGEGVEELRKKVREGQEEAGRLRRDNARLKREVLGLRSQLKEG